MVSKERIRTNHILLDELEMWEEFSVKSIKDEWSLRYYNYLMNSLNKQIDKSIEWLDSDEAKEFLFNETKYQEEIFENLESSLDEILDKGFISIDALLDEVYNKGKEIGYEDMETHVRFSLADRLALQIAKDYNYALVNNLSDDLRYKVRHEMFKGVIRGENPKKIANRLVNVGVEPLEGSTFTPKQRAVMIARTETSRIQNTGILQSYVNEGYKEVKLLTAGDENVCAICLKYAYEFNEDDEILFINKGNERIHKIEDIMGLIPFHPLCRCTVLSVWETKGEPPKEPFVTNLTENISATPLILGDDGRLYPIVGDTFAGRIQFERKYGVTADDLTEEELDFIRMYTKYGDSIINYELRGLKDNPDVPKIDPKEEWEKLAIERGIDLSFERALELAVSVFNKGKILDEPIVLVRRERIRHMELQEGESTYSDSGMVSTAIGKTVKENIYGTEINYIIVPQGKKVLYVEGVTATPKDFEVILPPNSNLKYIRDEDEKSKVWRLE